MKKILVIGGTGSLGHELAKTYKDQSIGIFSRNENKQWLMRKKYPQHQYFIGDIRDLSSVKHCILSFEPNIIILAAALKHVDICENFIHISNEINMGGFGRLLDWIYEQYNNVPFLHTVLFVSTDKAVEPITVYGMGKSISERQMIEMSRRIESKGSKMRFLITRYGNVVSSSGSVLPIFQEIAQDPTKPHIPVTHPDMTRFYMTLEDSVTLIQHTLSYGKSGEIWIPRLEGFRIMDVAKSFAKKYKKEITIIGLRGIEKIHEKLIASHEMDYVVVRKDVPYYVIQPTKPVVTLEPFDYSSNTAPQIINVSELIVP